MSNAINKPTVPGDHAPLQSRAHPPVPSRKAWSQGVGQTTPLIEALFEVEHLQLPELRVGVFAAPRGFQANIFFSSRMTGTGSGNDQNDQDTMSDLLWSLKIELLDFDGKKIEKIEKIEEFLLTNVRGGSPFKSEADYATFLASRRFFFPGANPREWRLREAWCLVKSALVAAYSQSPAELQFWSLPCQLGGHDVQYVVRPLSLSKAKSNLSNPRKVLSQQLHAGFILLDFGVQILDEQQQIGGACFKKQRAPFIKLATLQIPKQDFDRPTIAGIEAMVAV